MDPQPTTQGESKPLISINEEFENYLKLVYVEKWNRLPPGQLMEIRRAFFGGMSTAFVRLVIDTSNASWTDRDVETRLKTIEDALSKYWEFELQQKQQQQSPIIKP